MATPEKLDNGDLFPAFTAPSVEGGEMTIPEDVEGSWSLIVFYRGHW